MYAMEGRHLVLLISNTVLDLIWNCDTPKTS